MVEASGYTYNPPPDVVPNSHAALQITELARDRGLHKAVHTRLMDAYWSEAQNIGDHATLLDLVAGVGVDRGEAAEALAGGRYRDRIAAATREANMSGINAIPAFVLDARLLLVGAYPHETFERAFDQLDEMKES
jgi:predicted DsbA family dithiol-disulfide isomerase